MLTVGEKHFFVCFLVKSTYNLGKTSVEFSLIFVGVASKESKPDVAGGIIINIGADEFVLIGKNFNIELRRLCRVCLITIIFRSSKYIK